MTVGSAVSEVQSVGRMSLDQSWGSVLLGDGDWDWLRDSDRVRLRYLEKKSEART